MLCKGKIQKNFSRAAYTYDTEALVQDRAAKFLVELLYRHAGRDIKSIVDIGAGTGQATQQLLPYFPSARYTLNDISPYMLEVAASKFKDQENIFYIVGDAEEIVFEPTDLTISNLAFQWFANFERTISTLWDKTNILCFSIPCKGSFSQWEQILQELGLPSSLIQLPNPNELYSFLKSLRPTEFLYKRKIFKTSLHSPAACLRYFQALGANASSRSYPISSIRKILTSSHSPLVLTYDLFFALLVKS